MANFENFANKLLELEGGYVNHPKDKGGPTKFGVILSVWREHGHDKDGDGDIDAEDIKRLTESDARYIAKRLFWDYFRADEIINESIAQLVVDWGYHSGRTTVARIVQRILGVTVDGIVGSETLKALNTLDQEKLFSNLKIERKVFLNNIIRRKPDQIVFYDGWMNRLNKFQFRQAA